MVRADLPHPPVARMGDDGWSLLARGLLDQQGISSICGVAASGGSVSVVVLLVLGLSMYKPDRAPVALVQVRAISVGPQGLEPCPPEIHNGSPPLGSAPRVY